MQRLFSHSDLGNPTQVGICTSKAYGNQVQIGTWILDGWKEVGYKGHVLAEDIAGSDVVTAIVWTSIEIIQPD